MQIKDFLIDLNDLWGRFIPGTFIIIDFWFLLAFFPKFANNTLVAEIKSLSLPSSVLVLFCFLLAHTLGELSLYPIFKFRKLLPRPSAREHICAIDVTKEKEIVKFYERRFDGEQLSKGGAVFSFCKAFLLQSCPSAYAQARGHEARINLKGGLIIPLLALAIMAGIATNWVVCGLATILLACFFDGFRKSFSGEHRSVFKAYYLANTGAQTIGGPVENSKED